MWDWLGGIFGSLVHIFDPLKHLKQWKIWNEISQLYLRIKKWLGWWRDHYQKQIRALQQLQRQIYDTFFKPLLTIVDTVRRISQVVGLFNRRLADRLNVAFLRVESFLLAPFNKLTSRVNAHSGILQQILTPLGYFDRATLLNSLWRDIGKLRELIRNPLGGSISSTGTALRISPQEQAANVIQYLQTGQSPIAAFTDTATAAVRQDLEVS